MTSRPEAPPTQMPRPAKPSADALGVDLATLPWQRSGTGDGSLEVAFLDDQSQPGGWILMRVAGDPDKRTLIYDRHEWVCFLDGVRNGEFDDAAL
jgi:hypothetical protein